MIKKIIQYLTTPTKSEEQKYLESATDICDLENRMRRINYGTAPYQIKYRLFLNSHKGMYQ